MTLDEAKSEAILGSRIRADNMASGAYVYYDFTGFRICHADGSSSGWSSRDIDEAANWSVVDVSPPVVMHSQSGGQIAAPLWASGGFTGKGEPYLVGSKNPEPFPKIKLDPLKGGW